MSLNSQEEVPKYCRIVTIDEIADQEYNLNICRYVNNSPDLKPHDVTAHLTGGVPKAEVSAHAEVFSRYFLSDDVIFTKWDETCYDFISDISKKEDIREIIEVNPHVIAVEEEMNISLASWWEEKTARLSALHETNNLFSIREDFMISLKKALVPVGILDSFQVSGIFVNWWEKYRVSMREIEAERDEVKERLDTYLRELGYI